MTERWHRVAQMVPLLGFLLCAILFSLVVWSVQSRLAAIETALGGPEKIACNRFQAIKKITPSVVRIIGGEGEGSGFVYSRGRVMTNHHVVEFEPSPKIVYPDGSFETGMVIAVDEDRDLAIIQVSEKLPPIEWHEGIFLVGEEALAFGFPYGGEIDGDVSVNSTVVSAIRSNAGVHYLQVAGGLIEGMSGGPLVDLCGKVIGVNVMGNSNAIGLAVGSTTAEDFVNEAYARPERLTAAIARVDFKPDESPTETVKAYYNYIKTRNFTDAYGLLSRNFIGATPYKEWAEGFATQLDTTVLDIEPDPRNRWRVGVRLGSTDIIDGIFVYRRFEGTWIVRKEADGHLRLWESNIKEID